MFWLWLTSLHNPQTFTSAKLGHRFTEAPCDNFKFRGNLNYFALSLYLTDNIAMTNFLHYSPTCRWAKFLTLNVFSEVSGGQMKKAINFAL